MCFPPSSCYGTQITRGHCFNNMSQKPFDANKFRRLLVPRKSSSYGLGKVWARRCVRLGVRACGPVRGNSALADSCLCISTTSSIPREPPFHAVDEPLKTSCEHFKVRNHFLVVKKTAPGLISSTELHHECLEHLSISYFTLTRHLLSDRHLLNDGLWYFSKFGRIDYYPAELDAY